MRLDRLIRNSASRSERQLIPTYGVMRSRSINLRAVLLGSRQFDSPSPSWSLADPMFHVKHDDALRCVGARIVHRPVDRMAPRSLGLLLRLNGLSLLRALGTAVG